MPIASGIFNHPVVILSKETYHGKVAVLVVTSFDGTPIQNRHPDPARRQSYLPIRPARHPDTRCDLIAAHGKAMKKNSYVNIKDIHEIPFIALRPCWRDNDLHLETTSYQILTSELWKQNLGELAVRLKDHGIFEQVGQSAYSEVPVPVRVSHQSLGRDTNFARTSSSPLSASYGTFIQNSMASYPRSYASVLANAKAARDYNRPSGVYQFQQSVPVRHGDIPSQQSRFRTERRRYDEVNLEASGPNWLTIIAIICFLLAAWYWLADPTMD
ncbi:hypothetical protein FPCIR_1851 [Fusarium pseudocircinatum]|uniref:Uncharacterized protein n=1 Tax=Fusarium pseudocircinatum TaxID=56676 RepID=A0A8H5UYV9_9HYPO|nr:hypothetical protein FPCIR_1851 [Fusarium pseudocircinatum]